MSSLFIFRLRGVVLAGLALCSVVSGCDCSTEIRLALPKISVTPASVDFGTVPVGAIRGIALSVKNIGEGPLSISGVVFATPGGDLTLPAALVNDCNDNPRNSADPMVIDSGDCARVVVEFHPTAVESVSNTVLISSNDATQDPVKVPVTATSSELPCLQVTPTSVNFGTIAVGTTKEMSLSISNCGKTAYDVTKLDMTPANSTVFSLSASGGLPAVPFNFVAGESKTIDITYAPTTPTSSSGQGDTAEITVGTDSSAISDQVVPINGKASGPMCGTSAAPTAVIQVFNGSSAVTGSVLPLSTLTLKGTASTAPGSTIKSYTWTLASAPANNMSMIVGSGATVSLQTTLAGQYQVKLTIETADGCTAETTETVNVVPGVGLNIQLTWPESYGDLDLHYIAPGGVFFDDPGPLGGDLYYPYALGDFDEGAYTPNTFPMQIDWGKNDTYEPDGTHVDDPIFKVDQLWGKGPENAVHPQPFDADYTVKVHYYCSSAFDQAGFGQNTSLGPDPNCGSAEGGGDGTPCKDFGPATATVTIYFNGTQIWAGLQMITAKQVWDAATIHVTGSGSSLTATAAAATGGVTLSDQGCPDGLPAGH